MLLLPEFPLLPLVPDELRLFLDEGFAVLLGSLLLLLRGVTEELLSEELRAGVEEFLSDELRAGVEELFPDELRAGVEELRVEVALLAALSLLLASLLNELLEYCGRLS